MSPVNDERSSDERSDVIDRSNRTRRDRIVREFFRQKDEPTEEKEEHLHRVPEQAVLFYRCQNSIVVSANKDFGHHRNDLIGIDNQHTRTLKDLVEQRIGTSIDCLAETRDRQKTQHQRIPPIIDQLQRDNRHHTRFSKDKFTSSPPCGCENFFQIIPDVKP
jgi:hypothetical protein